MQNRRENGFLPLCTMAFASPITVTMTNASFFRIAWESAVLRSVYFKGPAQTKCPLENGIYDDAAAAGFPEQFV